jgi:hypothetical protein
VASSIRVFPRLAVEQLDLKARPERLDHRIVVGTADRAHRRRDPDVLDLLTEGPGRELPELNRSSQHRVIGQRTVAGKPELERVEDQRGGLGESLGVRRMG